MTMPRSLVYVTAVLLVVAAAPLPYGYYTFLRIVATAVFLWASFIMFERKQVPLALALAAVGVLFNPILKVSFSKEVWMVVDVAAAAFLLGTAKRFSNQSRGNR